MTSAARDLMDTGTPGPWTAHEGDLEGGTLVDYVSTLFANREDGTSTGRLFLTLAANTIDPERGAEIVPALMGDGPNAEANANKAARAVNALPLVDALIEATKTHLEFAYISRTMRPDRQTPYCRQCGRAWPCPTATARDALEAALRGEGDV